MRKDEVKETGIKQRIKNGKYIVSLDLGRGWSPPPIQVSVKRGKSSLQR